MKRAPVFFDNNLNHDARQLDLDVKTLRQISVEDLAIGMYVESLDKPWSESSFVLQGFCVRSKQDILDLQAECHFVNIDVSIKSDSQRKQGKVHFPVFGCRN